MIPPGEVDSYVESIVPESVSDQMNIMSSILGKRVGHRPHPDYLRISRYTVLLPCPRASCRQPPPVDLAEVAESRIHELGAARFEHLPKE